MRKGRRRRVPPRRLPPSRPAAPRLLERHPCTAPIGAARRLPHHPPPLRSALPPLRRTPRSLFRQLPPDRCVLQCAPHRHGPVALPQHALHGIPPHGLPLSHHHGVRFPRGHLHGIDHPSLLRSSQLTTLENRMQRTPRQCAHPRTVRLKDNRGEHDAVPSRRSVDLDLLHFPHPRHNSRLSDGRHPRRPPSWP